MSCSILKQTLVRARGNKWVHPLGSWILRIPGAGGVIRRFMHAVLPKGIRVWVQIPIGPAKGLWLKVEPYLEEQYATGCPEPAVLADIVNNLRTGGCFYDIGAHIGFYSLLAARLVGREGRVVAFEPDPANVAVFQENLARNNFSEVDVITAAVWNRSGHVTFERSAVGSSATSSRRGSVVGRHAATPNADRIKVPTITLDDFARDRRPPTMIKIDVEGAEAEVLQGARKMIAKTRPILLVEVHHQAAATFLDNLLQQDNYRIEWHARHPKFPFPRHLLALPERP